MEDFKAYVKQMREKVTVSRWFDAGQQRKDGKGWIFFYKKNVRISSQSLENLRNLALGKVFQGCTAWKALYPLPS